VPLRFRCLSKVLMCLTLALGHIAVVSTSAMECLKDRF